MKPVLLRIVAIALFIQTSGNRIAPVMAETIAPGLPAWCAVRAAQFQKIVKGDRLADVADKLGCNGTLMARSGPVDIRAWPAVSGGQFTVTFADGTVTRTDSVVPQLLASKPPDFPCMITGPGHAFTSNYCPHREWSEVRDLRVGLTLSEVQAITKCSRIGLQPETSRQQTSWLASPPNAHESMAPLPDPIKVTFSYYRPDRCNKMASVHGVFAEGKLVSLTEFPHLSKMAD